MIWGHETSKKQQKHQQSAFIIIIHTEYYNNLLPFPFNQQLHESIRCFIDHFRTGQKDRIDFRTACARLLWHRHFPRVFQVVVHFVGHPRSVCAIRESVLCVVPRRHLG